MRCLQSFDRRPSTALMSGVALAMLTAAVAPALAGARAAKPTSGQALVGETSGGHVAVVVSRDGRQATRAFVAYAYHCSDGKDFSDFDGFRAVPISANRTFKAGYDTGQQASTAVPGTSFKATGSIDGTMNKARTRIIGSARFTFVTTDANAGTTVTCDTGTIHFTAKD